MTNRVGVLAWGLFALAGGLCVAADRGVQLDAKEVALPDLLRLLAVQGGPTLAVHPDVADEKVTFAAKDMSPWPAVRWLCRTCNLIVAEAKDGRLALARPTLEASADKEYAVAKVVPTQEAADALVSFLKKTIFELHPGRVRTEQGTLEPAFEATCQNGKLKVFATPIVQREVLTLLRAIAKVQPKRGFEDVRVAYASHELGFLGPRPTGVGPKLVGEVSLSLADVPAPQAAWALTSAAKTSFYVDPWDEGLGKARVTFQAEKQPLKDIAEALAKQLGAERCWYDEAWVFVRKGRRPLFEAIVARAYNTSGAGGRWGRFPFVRDLFQVTRDLLGRNLPFAIERADDLLLVCAPPEAHKAAEDLLKAPVDDGPPRHRPGPKGGGHKGR
ncbi:MAG TPA: hypothetical protein VNE39_01100 [Planctomycetota bacterium]|nr:hypothetical protein [Planctomycetota bacterium]